jgi:hypothetical protein
MTPTFRTLPLALALAAMLASPEAQAQPAADPAGPYAVVAVGRSQYDYDCYIFSYCDTARATTGRLGLGYRFGVFALEGWVANYGKASIQQGWAQMRVQSAGVNAAWYLRFTPTLHGVLRAGGGQVVQTRSDDVRSSGFEGSFGLGLVMFVAPSVGVELAVDATTATGQNSGTAVVSSATLGLRLRF